MNHTLFITLMSFYVVIKIACTFAVIFIVDYVLFHIGDSEYNGRKEFFLKHIIYFQILFWLYIITAVYDIYTSEAVQIIIEVWKE